MNTIAVWREYQGDIEPVGSIDSHDGDIRFAYNSTYTGQAISASLPVQPLPFSAQATAHFFRALIPEGTAQKEFAQALHAEKGDFSPFLARLNDESIGALLFSTNGATPYENASYQPVDPTFFEEFARRPLETAVATMGRTRLSLSGAMAKVGLYRDPADSGWHFPLGAAPSTHIVKAADGKRFPLETINEALCLGIAQRCALPTASCELIAAEDEPLLAVERFDRIREGGDRVIDGYAAPLRLYQEDFCQVKSLSLKYEPTDGHYLGLITNAAREFCVNGFGEAALLLEYTFFHYLIGNCDNHLKNYSMLYDANWNVREIAPLYDVVSTVAYPDIYLEMGVSFGSDRRIDHVNREIVDRAVASCGIPPAIAQGALRELAQAIPGALEAEADALANRGFLAVRQLVDPLMAGFNQRKAALDI